MLKGNDWEFVEEMRDPETDELIDPETVTAIGQDSAGNAFVVEVERLSAGRYKFTSDTEPLPTGPIKATVSTTSPKGRARRSERIVA